MKQASGLHKCFSTTSMHIQFLNQIRMSDHSLAREYRIYMYIICLIESSQLVALMKDIAASCMNLSGKQLKLTSSVNLVTWMNQCNYSTSYHTPTEVLLRHKLHIYVVVLESQHRSNAVFRRQTACTRVKKHTGLQMVTR